MRKKILITSMIMAVCAMSFSQTVTVTINSALDSKPISPAIYGKNNCTSDNPDEPLTANEWKFLNDAGVRMVRENGGNNATKYNWRRKLTSHPDWYNNVYSHDWDYCAQQLQKNMPGIYGMFAFQLIGKSAANKNNNFNDWNYNNSQWWSGVAQNLAGGGTPNAAGGEHALKEGDPNRYLINWDADSTTGIITHWFDKQGLALNNEQFKYWSMDNEPEIWSGTHDDVYPSQPSAEEFMQHYFAVAKKARALFPGIKLCGPVTCNEWQWYNYDNKLITSGGKKYSWLEFFIKRVAEEQNATGIRLLDILDLHFYPGEWNDADIVQLHRVFYDKNYDYPGANGCKTLNGGWDENLTKEYVFERCKTWLENYMGPNHNVTFGLSELGFNDKSASVNAVCYASILGTFANNGVELFTPWSWLKGMWETLHLFSRYSREYSCSSISGDEKNLSAYTSFNADSMTIILVNRSVNKTYSADISILTSLVPDGSYKTLQLKNLPESESFKSHTNNALISGDIQVNNANMKVSAPPLSITAILLKADSPVSIPKAVLNKGFKVWQDENRMIFFNYYAEKESSVKINLIDLNGRNLKTNFNVQCSGGTHEYRINAMNLKPGLYMLELNDNKNTITQKIMIH